MKLPRRKISASGSGCCVTSGGIGLGKGTSLSIPAGALDRAVRTSRRDGPYCAAHRARLSERLDQQFVIENRPGAGSNVGTEAVVRAAPDGYTLGLFGAPSAINATLYDKLNFNFVRDIAPIAPIVRFPYIMVVNPSVPAKTLPEFIAYAKANPGKINMASPGSGSTPHHRQAQQGDRCRRRRPQDEGAACRPRRHRADRLTQRLRKAHRGRDLEVGQGGEIVRRQAGLIDIADSSVHCARGR
jgi:hypothetical protein